MNVSPSWVLLLVLAAAALVQRTHRVPVIFLAGHGASKTPATTPMLLFVAALFVTWALWNDCPPTPAIRENYEPPRTMVRNRACTLGDTTMRGKGDQTASNPDILVVPQDARTITIPGNLANPSIIPAAQATRMIYPNPDNCGFQPVGPEYASRNQKLVGQANPKTRNTPIVPNRAFDTDVWSNDSFFVPSGINRQYNQEFYQNGYIETCPSVTCGAPKSMLVQENYCCGGKTDANNGKHTSSHHNAHLSSSSSSIDCAPHPTASVPLQERVTSSMINAPYGLFPGNAERQEPINFPPNQMGMCNSARYNAELNTTLLQPNLVAYSNINVNDANQSNLGISFTQPHLPTKLVDIPGTDAQAFVEVDLYTDPKRLARLATSSSSGGDRYDGNDDIQENFAPTHSPYQTTPTSGRGQPMDPRTIYDPRLTGYGTSYRQYTDEMTGQPRFYYDDVDAQRQYNFVTRTKVDFLPQLASSGPYEPQRLSNMEVRQLAEQAFHNDTLQQRTELQDRLMQKVIHRTRQRKQAPIRVHN
ncbi:hypothetical protein EBZ80_14235 [bacterium]|nr:hypothetical protein [bacterium]